MDLAILSLKMSQKFYFALMKMNPNVATRLMAGTTKLLEAHCFRIVRPLALVYIMERLSLPDVRRTMKLMKVMKNVEQRLKWWICQRFAGNLVPTTLSGRKYFQNHSFWLNSNIFAFLKTIFSSIYLYSTASTSDAVYIIGGFRETETGSSNSLIAHFRNDKWNQDGTLIKGRYGHESITIGEKTMIFGGYTWGQ